MGRRSWIQFIGSQVQARDMIKFIEEEESICFMDAVNIKGQIFTNDGRSLGKKNEQSLALFTQSEGNWAIKEMIKHRITDHFHTILIDDLARDELELGETGVMLKNAEYIKTRQEFYTQLDELPEDSPYATGLTIGTLKSLLDQFKDDDFVSIFLRLHDDDHPDKHHGRLYEVENWVNNNGNINLWISDSFNLLENYIQFSRDNSNVNCSTCSHQGTNTLSLPCSKCRGIYSNFSEWENEDD